MHFLSVLGAVFGQGWRVLRERQAVEFRLCIQMKLYGNNTFSLVQLYFKKREQLYFYYNFILKNAQVWIAATFLSYISRQMISLKLKEGQAKNGQYELLLISYCCIFRTILQYFLMFCCFSKKKNKAGLSSALDQQPLPSKGQRQPGNPVRHNKRLQSITSRLKDNVQLSKFGGGHGEGNTEKQFQHIDNLLKQQVEVDSSHEATGKFIPNFSSRHRHKFSNISDENEYHIRVVQPEGFRDEFTFKQEYVNRQDGCDIPHDIEEELGVPKIVFAHTQSIAELNHSESKANLSSGHSKEGHSQIDNFSEVELVQIGVINMEGEEEAIGTTITLQHFRQKLHQIPAKAAEQFEDDEEDETYEQAENSFYCIDGGITEQFTRAVVAHSSPHLAKSLFLKMSKQQKNKKDVKGFTPVQVVVEKALLVPEFTELAKFMAYDSDISLQCRGPAGWTPLQEALLHRSIPLATHIFKAGYIKRQQKFRQSLIAVQRVLVGMPDFELVIEVKVDSFLPLVGALAPSDTLKVRKVGGKVSLEYSLVGYQFPICKRRAMGVVVEGAGLWGVNRSKGWYCDLLQELDQQQMVLLVEDMLLRDVRRGEPIVHQFALKKSLSLFDNEIKEEIGQYEATKYQLQLRYTSTAEKRKSNSENRQELSFLSDYGRYRQHQQQVGIQEKNKNKKVQLEVWLAADFGVQLQAFVQVVEMLGAGNHLLAKWSAFLKQNLLPLVAAQRLFPVKIDLPLNYSLYFNIEFTGFRLLEGGSQIDCKQGLKRVGRKEFQGVVQSRQKRALFLQAYT